LPSYWKGKDEVDFVVQNRRGIIPVQVTFEEFKPRRTAALEEFYREFPQALEEVVCNPDNFPRAIEELAD
jgi:predicted AAA+ superfamily ATPase